MSSSFFSIDAALLGVSSTIKLLQLNGIAGENNNMDIDGKPSRPALPFPVIAPLCIFGDPCAPHSARSIY